MRLVDKLTKLGFCVARVAEEREDHTWLTLPRHITVHSIVFNKPEYIYVMDSIAGGSYVVFNADRAPAKLNISRERRSYDLSVPGSKSDGWATLYSKRASNNEGWSLEEALAEIKSDRKLKQALDKLANSWNS
jgi:hypothetical protein